MKQFTKYLVCSVVPLASLCLVQSVFAHPTISPLESRVGGSEIYEIRVPTERDSPTVQIRVEFPKGVTVSDFTAEIEGEIELVENSKGRIICAIWSGGSVELGKTQEFRFTALNPDRETSLVWDVTQIHADGSRAKWVGNRTSRNPAPIVEIRNN